MNLKFATKLGSFCKNTKGGLSLWDIKWENDVKDLIKKENGRIYFILVNNEIVKIGCSECKGGMKTTFGFYKGGLGGSPSIRTFGIHHLINKELEKGHNIQIYGMWNEPIEVLVKGIFTESTELIYPSVKSMEDKCRNDYKSIYKCFPIWNFQENGEEWPDWIKNLYKEQVQNRG
jgi:hypothetical protein